MLENLPKGWVKTRLGEVCLPVERIQPEALPDADFTYFDIGGIDNESNRITETKTVTGRNAPSRARQALRKNDILFSTVRTNLRKIARVESDYPNPIASTGFAVIRTAEGVSPEFLFFQVLSEAFVQPLTDLQTGSSYPAVRASDVFAQPILIPPTREQERIAAKLTAAFLGVERAERATRRAQERIKKYRASVLDAALNGKLKRPSREVERSSEPSDRETGANLLHHLLVARRERWEEAEVRRLDAGAKPPKDDKWKSRYREATPPKTDGLPKEPKRWSWASIDQLAWSSGYGTSIKSTYEGKGPPVLRIPNIRNRTLDFEDLKFAGPPNTFKDEDYVAPGDLLIIRTNGSKDLIGRAAIVKSEPERKCTFASYLIRFRLVGDETLWSWISVALGSSLLRAEIESRAATTAGQYNVSLSGLVDLAIPLPPTDEQVEIVSEVERRLSAADRLEAALKQQFVRAIAARELLLREAFSGRLLPQDPRDEAASLLLERIRTVREVEAQKPKGRRMSRSKPKVKNAERRDLLTVLKENGGQMTPEELFVASGHSQESVDQFFAELRDLTTSPARLVEERKSGTQILLRSVS
jgi:type I restriction enzyme S subunit